MGQNNSQRIAPRSTTMRQILVLGPVFVAGVMLGAWALSRPGGPAATDSSRGEVRAFEQAGEYERLERMIDSLTEIVNFEVGERRRLENKIDEVSAGIAALGADTQAGAEQDARVRVARRDVAVAAPGARPRGGTQVSEQRFLDAGFPADVASRLKGQMDDIAMQRLYLRDQAVREGWLGSARYREELRDLSRRENDIRTELSPEDYDRYLYALGRPNRIQVNSVLSGSPADQAGLRAGDQILSYDGSRVFSPGEIRRETSGGTRGEFVAVEVLRDGQPQVVYVPRGPLGVQMGASVTRP